MCKLNCFIFILYNMFKYAWKTLNNNQYEKVVDNITEKVSALDKVFEIIGLVTGKFTAVTDKIVDVIASLLEKLFKRKDEIDE